MDSPLLICDGLNVFMRHFCANPSMSENGEHVGGFVGFIKGLGILCENFSPSQVIIVWESGGNLRRRAIMSSYKSGRRPASLNRYYEDDIPATSSNHTMQISLLTKALANLPVTQIYVKDCEADDVIGYLARYTFRNRKAIIVSSDKDFYQLISHNITQYSPGQKKIIDENAVVQKFGIHPVNFATARSFIGDSSDDVEGIKGVGFKSIARWFPALSSNDFVSCEEIVNTAKEISQKNKGKTIKAISDNLDLAIRNWRLMYLDTSNLSADQIQKVEGQLENIGKSDKMKLLRMMSKHGMQGFDIDRHFAAVNTVRYR